jgi:micrococcal nuclease
MRSTLGVFVLMFALWCGTASTAQQKLTPAEATAHVGESATVCGTAASIHQATRSKGEPTFINLDKPYPNQIFTILIWGSDRYKFGNPEQKYADQRVCVTGTITSFHGVPEVVVHDPSAVKLE